MSIGELAQRLGDKLLRDEPLAKYTAARIGGPAEYLYLADSADGLKTAVCAAKDQGLAVRILGGGANVLVSDTGIKGLVILNRLKTLQFTENQDTGEYTGFVVAEAGVSLTTVARECAVRGLTGFEWAVSVPGTVGGAVVNNAGAHGTEMVDAVQEIGTLDTANGAWVSFLSDDLEFDYRTSKLKQTRHREHIVLWAGMQFAKADQVAIRARMDAYRAHRKRTQPPGASLGSIFKNPPGGYAGRLIEAAGLKGFAIGGAAVSTIHANFFVNTGGATATDYAALVWHVQREVERFSGVRLEPEIEMIGVGF